jgi:hypothetical protein
MTRCGVLQVAEEVCALEEAAEREDAAAMRARCDGEGAPWVSWYRRHRARPADADAPEEAPPPPLPA